VTERQSDRRTSDSMRAKHMVSHAEKRTIINAKVGVAYAALTHLLSSSEVTMLQYHHGHTTLMMSIDISRTSVCFLLYVVHDQYNASVLFVILFVHETSTKSVNSINSRPIVCFLIFMPLLWVVLTVCQQMFV